MRQEEITIYKLDELPEETQAKVISNWRSNDEYPWSTENQESLNVFCRRIGIMPPDFDYGQSAWVESAYLDAPVQIKCGACGLTGFWMDEAILTPIRKAKGWVNNTTLNEALQEWVKDCNSDYENWLTDESIKSDIEANEYEFTENGTLYN